MPKSTEQPNNRKTVIIAAVIVAIVLAGLGYFAWQKYVDQTTRETTGTIPPQQEDQLAATGTQIPLSPAEHSEESQTGALASPEITPAPPTTAVGPCKEATDKIQAFYRHLDKQEYVKTYALKESSEKHFARIAKKLFANPPVVTRETDDLFTILTNSAHFYRIIGKNDLLLIKAVLTQETDNLETVMTDFYHWAEIEQTCNAPAAFSLHLPLSSLYEYAGFFLNTLGGQSYLFRRESRTRTLIKYYAVLIIDQANKKGLNRHGIDIRTPLRSTIEDLEASKNIVKRDPYLEKLQLIQAKYQDKYRNK